MRAPCLILGSFQHLVDVSRLGYIVERSLLVSLRKQWQTSLRYTTPAREDVLV